MHKKIVKSGPIQGDERSFILENEVTRQALASTGIIGGDVLKASREGNFQFAITKDVKPLTDAETEELAEYMLDIDMYNIAAEFLFDADGDMMIDEWRRAVLKMCRQLNSLTKEKDDES